MVLFHSKNATAYKKLNDREIRFLRKIFITWLKKEGFFKDYIESKMHLKIHYRHPDKEGWPHDLNESGIYYFFIDYCNIIDRTLDYYRCRGIRNDWGRINDKWHEFTCKHEPLIVNSLYKTK